MTSPSVVTLGEALIDFVPLEAGVPLERVPTFQRSAGGAPANVAVALSRLGTRAAFIGKVGSDPFGRFLRQTLADEGVDLRGLIVTSDAQTPLAFVGLDGAAGRSFAFYHAGMADTLLRPDEIDDDLIACAEVFHFGGVTLASEPSRAATLHAAQVARAHGRLVSFDANLRLELWTSAEDAFAHLTESLACVDVLKTSADELEFLTDSSDIVAGCRRLRRYGPSLVVVTLGGDGCYYDSGVATGSLPAPRVDALDTLGAGDAFTAGLLAGLMRGALRDQSTLEESLRFANAVGAITTTRHGAIPALPTRAEVEQLLQSLAH